MSIYSCPLFFRIILLLVFALPRELKAEIEDVVKADAVTIEVESRYNEMIAEEYRQGGSEKSYEAIASGAAAIVIGLYGYYNTSPNPIVKLLYAATQTAGVLTIGQAMKNKTSPRLLIDIDRTLKASHDGKVDIDSIKDQLVHYRSQSKRAEVTTLAYTSSILSMLYFFNGYREPGAESTLRNVYYFLGFNFAIAGGVGFYQIYNYENQRSQVEVNFAPLPTLTYRF